jgi:tetratricopeptide (TPR) repeat protein
MTSVAEQAAERLMQAGRLDEAAAQWKQVLAAQPGHPRALLHLGQHALYRRQPQDGMALLTRALEADPGNPTVALNLAFAWRALGDTAREMDALVRALTIDPYFLPALLARAQLFERLGKPRLAARIYNDVLTIVPPGARVEPWLEEQLALARKSVEANRAAIAAALKPRLDAARAAGADTSRFDEARDIMIGAAKPMPSQPTLLAYPRLPAVPFYDRKDFPWLAELEKQTPVIQEELAALLAGDGAGFAPYVHHPDGVPLNQWAGLNHNPDWSAYFLLKDGVPVEPHCAQCPRTAALLKTLPLAQIPGIAPSAFFSVLKPRTKIPPHTGVTNTRVIVHLPLIVPDGCWYRVGNETRQWEAGKALIFDDSIEHEAWNGSDQIRVLLIFDIWNPYLEDAEKALIGELLIGYEAYYAAESW